MPQSSKEVKERNQKLKVRGRILLFNFNKPEDNTVELKIVGSDLNQTDFWPHGIDGIYNEKTGIMIRPKK